MLIEVAAVLATLPINAVLTFFKPESTQIFTKIHHLIIFCHPISPTSLPCNNFIVAVFRNP